MPRIRCHYVDCVFLDEGYCAAAAIELDPEEGCLTYSPSGDVSAEDVWGDGDADLEEDWAEAGFGAEGDDEADWDADEDDDDLDAD